ncbi:RipA family octameric membrane protein [Mangrovicoccus ximenensis]|uniref:RipA family octameric membrane protein n=1 Tax=Mangrovicoccus ximenensis TaxID=1911570 RepID=UPI000D3BF8C6|nr:hypothetical protein [Mangrovicoccus ximenensis]
MPMTMPPDDFDLYKLYLETAEKVSDRRGAANQWLLSVNSAVVGLYGYLSSGKAGAGDAEQIIWRWAIPCAGILVCLAWTAILASYRKLNAAKFKVLQEIEAGFPHQPFAKERSHYKADKRLSLSKMEQAIPLCFAALYACLLVAALRA